MLPHSRSQRPSRATSALGPCGCPTWAQARRFIAAALGGEGSLVTRPQEGPCPSSHARREPAVTHPGGALPLSWVSKFPPRTLTPAGTQDPQPPSPLHCSFGPSPPKSSWSPELGGRLWFITWAFTFSMPWTSKVGNLTPGICALLCDSTGQLCSAAWEGRGGQKLLGTEAL